MHSIQDIFDQLWKEDIKKEKVKLAKGPDNVDVSDNPFQIWKHIFSTNCYQDFSWSESVVIHKRGLNDLADYTSSMLSLSVCFSLAMENKHRGVIPNDTHNSQGFFITHRLMPRSQAHIGY